MKDTDAICKKLDHIYGKVDGCLGCNLGALPLNSPPRMRCKPGKRPVLVVAQNPGQRKEGKHIWGGLNLLFGRIEGMRELASQVWVTNLVKCCTQDNQRPTLGQIRCCQDWLEQEIDAIEPKRVIALGRLASEWLGESLNGIPVHSDHHPRYIQFRPGDTAEYFDRLKKAASI